MHENTFMLNVFSLYMQAAKKAKIHNTSYRIITALTHLKFYLQNNMFRSVDHISCTHTCVYVLHRSFGKNLCIFIWRLKLARKCLYFNNYKICSK